MLPGSFITGSFSDYEPLVREEWAQAGLNWNGQRYEVDWAQWKRLAPTQVEDLHHSIELVPVFEVLNAIGWTKR